MFGKACIYICERFEVEINLCYKTYKVAAMFVAPTLHLTCNTTPRGLINRIQALKIRKFDGMVVLCFPFVIYR